MTTTPLPEPHIYEWTNDGWVNNFYSKDRKGTKQTALYTAEHLHAHAAAVTAGMNQVATLNAEICVSLKGELAAKDAEIERLRADAARYQWLCEKGHSYHGAMVGTGSMSQGRGPYIRLEPPSHNNFSNMALGKEAADAIIDAAITGSKS